MASQTPSHVYQSEFATRPNPLEPHATTDKHPLNGSSQLGKSAQKEFLDLFGDDNAVANDERPSKRRRPGEPNAMDLPKLPTVSQGTKRLRIPPTLSGLHQPPPDAGLLPSMSIDTPVNLMGKSEDVRVALPRSKSREAQTQSETLDHQTVPGKQSVKKPTRKHRKWSERETADLLKGVQRFGIGHWTKILKCSDFEFANRTALDLKDRFRVCCPEEYEQGRSTKRLESAAAVMSTAAEKASESRTTKTNNKRSDRISAVQLENLGIDGPFEKSKRRQRTEWTKAEDEALLAGFKAFGNSWAAIRNGTAGLEGRTTTDLRDRLRTKYPHEYAKLGLTPRSEHANQKEQSKDDVIGKTGQSLADPAKAVTSSAGKENDQAVHLPHRKPPPTSILHVDDVFWGAPFEPDNADSEPITLDRGILDWAVELRGAAMSQDNSTRIVSIDPLATLNLPRPTATNYVNGTPSATLAPPQNAVSSASSANPLPSLAEITAVSDADNWSDTLELPSLMSIFGSLENDGRTGGHFMSMEELLS